MSVFTYSPEDVLIVWSAKDENDNIAPEGLDLTDGFAEGTFLTVSTDEDLFMKNVGANGKVVRTRNANKSGTVELTLMQQSLANIQLMLAAYNDSNGDQRIGNIYVISKGGEVPVVLQAIEDAWIRKTPDETASKENGERTWIFDAARIETGLKAQDALNLATALGLDITSFS